jgi:transposase-like protein
MTKGLNEQVEEFRNRSLTAASYPVLWIDAMYEKVRYASRVVSMVIEPMLEESQESYKQLFEKLKKRGLSNPKLIISDAHKGLIAAIG